MNSKKEKKKECPSCAMMIDANEDICPFCKYEFPQNSFTFKLGAVILLIAIILYFVL